MAILQTLSMGLRSQHTKLVLSPWKSDLKYLFNATSKKSEFQANQTSSQSQTDAIEQLMGPHFKSDAEVVDKQILSEKNWDSILVPSGVFIVRVSHLTWLISGILTRKTLSYICQLRLQF